MTNLLRRSVIKAVGNVMLTTGLPLERAAAKARTPTKPAAAASRAGSRRAMQGSRTILVAVLSIVMTRTAWAQSKRRPTYEELERRIQRLEQIIREHGLDKPVAPKPSAPVKAQPAPRQVPEEQVERIVDEKMGKQKPLAGWKDGFFLESRDGSYKLHVGGYLQTQGRFPLANSTDAQNSSFFLRRARPIIEGTVAKWFDFRIMPDFGEGKAVIRDGYMDVTYFAPYLKLRGGKTKVPLSLEWLQPGSNLLFVERSIANGLSPHRDVGIYLFGDVLDSQLAYQVGVFDGTLDHTDSDGDINSGKELAARVFWSPFRSVDFPYLKGLAIGAATTYGNDDDGESLSSFGYKTAEDVTWFEYTRSSSITATQSGNRARVDPQGYYFWGPFSLMAEWIWEREGVTQVNSKTGRTKEGTFDNTGWMAQATYVIGGDASYNGVVPRNNFDPRDGYWGAVEIGLRGSQLNVDDKAFEGGFADPSVSGGKATEVTAGVNWYLNKNFKLQLNYVRTEFDHDIEINDRRFSGVQSFLMQLQVLY